MKNLTEEWLDFIIDCRAGKSHSHDIVIGAMANDQIYNFVSDYIDGVITRQQFWSMAKFKYPTHQINFCTEQSLKCLRFEYCEGEILSKIVRDFKKCPETITAAILYQIFTALSYLHKNKVFYTCLNPEFILIKKQLEI